MEETVTHPRSAVHSCKEAPVIGVKTCVVERWGSLAEMTLSVSGQRAAHPYAHLDAIRYRNSSESYKPENRDRESCGGHYFVAEKDKDMERISMSSRVYQAPRGTDSFYRNRRKDGLGQSIPAEDKENIHAAASALNQFHNDGSFLQIFKERQQDQGTISEQEHVSPVSEKAFGQTKDDHQTNRFVISATDSVSNTPSENLSANQVASKALQLRLHGKTREADELMHQLHHKREKDKELSAQLEARNQNASQLDEESHACYKPSIVGNYRHRLEKGLSGDAELVNVCPVHCFLQHNQDSMSICVDGYDCGIFKGNPKLKNSKRKSSQAVMEREETQAIGAHKRIITQEERCQFCFNNQSRPKHLTISIANSCYLMLPPWKPLIDGHCLIVPMQHECASRNVDDVVWEELRNYKKCLLQMFAKQGRDVIFMETVINLAQQRRHCLIECIPIPSEKAKQAPLYFKKAIDEAEDEWSQHDAKKLIDTSMKGLRGCIPKNFPYFHVEFGLRAGYVHVIDNEREFKPDFGRNVVIGMLMLPGEEMYTRRKQQSSEQQRKAALHFQASWDPFDWTKALD